MPGQPKANGKGSYRSPYWFYPKMEGTGKRSPHTSLEPYHVMLERYENEEQLKNLRSCWYAGDKKKLTKIQDKYEKDAFGRVVLLRLDKVMIANKIERLTYTPLYYKGVKLVLQCIERPDCRTLMKAENTIVITEQLQANDDRKSIQWEYIPGKYGHLPNFKAHVVDSKQEVI
ncbi:MULTISPECIES: hypothetical protein [Enterobacter cloacae complex]|uniref:hypothetical protein n=1 Tax=Enterobacter cloacae complex TaxID=354276 RepID=UPI00101398AA|nr:MULTISPECIES: hypothetical protein [Enterobacter cloacae complex]MDQ6584450.1 hypothetical protein [Enterobacter hormaechei]RYA41437.1 hypothetical protein DD603_13010 [Enterobacter cloacae complex sp. 2DZ2F2B]RYA45719.1 hypothetical protein DD605_06330 [Enterobacter cloacae complex sp. 3DZ3S2B]